MTIALDIAGYYDGFRDRLIEDYRLGNRRVVQAIAFAKDVLVDTHSILDVGCGIGWSSAAMADGGHDVTGFDISPVLIKTAGEMFDERCKFSVCDFAADEIYGLSGLFDAVLMIDVYEHFPRELRPRVHECLRQISAKRIVLAMPTPEAQQYARDQGIALQPIDEDVTDEDIEQLAADTGAEIMVNRCVSVWRADDYRHVLLEVGT